MPINTIYFGSECYWQCGVLRGSYRHSKEGSLGGYLGYDDGIFLWGTHQNMKLRTLLCSKPMDKVNLPLTLHS